MNSEHQEIAAILSFNLVAPVRMRSSLKHQSMAWVETTIRSNVDRIGAGHPSGAGRLVDLLLANR